MPVFLDRVPSEIDRPGRSEHSASLAAYALIRYGGRSLEHAVLEVMSQNAKESHPSTTKLLGDLRRWSEEDGFTLEGQDPETGMVRSYAAS